MCLSLRFTFGLVSYVCEALILIYLGLSVDSFEGTSDMISYAVADFAILFVCRFFTLFLLAFIMRLIKGKNKDGLSSKELVIVGLSGMIRGSIAYALMVKLAYHGVDKKDETSMKKSK